MYAMFVRSLEISALLLFLLLTLLSQICLCAQGHVDLDFVAREVRYEQAETKLTEFKSHAQLPRYGKCWTSALAMLDAGCKHLTEETQQRLAVEFSHCFLLKAGRPTEKCEDSQPVAACTTRMQPEAFQAYQEYYTHTQNICFYLLATVWQSETENTIERLADNSAVVAQQLGDANELQSELLRQQNVSLMNQQVLIVSGEELRQTIENSKVDVRSMMTDLQKTTYEQRALIFEVFDRVRSLRSIVMGEFTGFYSLIFYFFAVLIAYVLTSTPRTSSSRFWLFVVLTLNMATEWLLTKWCSGREQLDPFTGHLLDENTLVYSQIKSCRMVFVALAAFLWGWMAYKYQDLNHINNILLLDIKRQNAELKNLLLISPRNMSAVCMDSPNGVENSTGYGTFSDVAVDDKDCARHRPDNQPTPTVSESLINLGHKLNQYLSSHSNTNISAGETLSVSLVDSPAGSTPTRRPRRRRNELRQLRTESAAGHAEISPPSTPLQTTSQYNLRSRNSTPQSGPLYVIEPVLVNGQVEHLRNVTARNTAKTIHTVQHALRIRSTESDDD